MKKSYRKRGKSLAQVIINKQVYSIRATEHAQKRMMQRQVDEYVVAGNMLALGKDRFIELQEEQEDFIVIDTVKNISIVASFNKNTISIITVIDKANVFVKDNTSIVNL